MVHLIPAAGLSIVATSALAFTPFTTRFNLVDDIKKHAATRGGLQDDAPAAFFTQKLDHTNSSNPTTWQQRYFYYDGYYGGPGSPVFVLLGGEAAMEAGVITYDGLNMNALGKKHKALLVTVEHRFYGESQPRPDFSLESLKFLSADQALADLNTFQDHATTAFNLTAASKWVAFGGSYAGMLSAWAKLKHPTRWAGALSSSGPILAKYDFHEYADKVAFGLHYFGKDECVNTIQAGLKAFDALVGSTTPDDVARLQALFNPCTPIKDNYERMVLEYNVFGQFQNLAQGNDWLPENLKTACEFFTTPSDLTPLEKLAKYTAPSAADNCILVNYNQYWVDPLKDTSVSPTSWGRQWVYQTCAEFGFAQTTSTSPSIFSALRFLDLEAVSIEVCRQVYGLSKADTDAAVAATNNKYGGWSIDVENVIFSNGNIDPWSGLGLTNATNPVVNPLSEVVYIDGTSHCRDLYAPFSSDSASLNWAHERIDAALDRYLRNRC